MLKQKQLFEIMANTALAAIVTSQTGLINPEKSTSNELPVPIEQKQSEGRFESMVNKLKPGESMLIPEIMQSKDGYYLGIDPEVDKGIQSPVRKLILELRSKGIPIEPVKVKRWLEDCGQLTLKKNENEKISVVVVLPKKETKDGYDQACKSMGYETKRAENWNYQGGDIIADPENKRLIIGLNTIIESVDLDSIKYKNLNNQEILPRLKLSPASYTNLKAELSDKFVKNFRRFGYENEEGGFNIPDRKIDQIISRLAILIKKDFGIQDWEMSVFSNNMFHTDVEIRLIPKENTNIDPKYKGLILLPSYDYDKAKIEQRIKLMKEFNIGVKVRNIFGEIDYPVDINHDYLKKYYEKLETARINSAYNFKMLEALGYKVVKVDSNYIQIGLNFAGKISGIKNFGHGYGIVNQELQIPLNGLLHNKTYYFTTPDLREHYAGQNQLDIKNPIIAKLLKLDEQDVKNNKDNFISILSEYGINSYAIKSTINSEKGGFDCLTVPNLVNFVNRYNGTEKNNSISDQMKVEKKNLHN
jgi:hypothetical protein